MKEIRVAQLVRQVFAPLAGRAAQNDRDAAIELICAAHMLCSAVEGVRCAQPELIRSIARCMDTWPSSTARHVAARRGLRKLLAELQLSESHPDRHILAPKGKGPDLDNEYNSVALEIRDRLTRLRGPRFADDPIAQLINALVPEKLTPTSFETWWHYGWSLFLRQNFGDPFNDRRLAAKRSNCEQPANYDGISAAAYIERPIKQAARKLWFARFR